MCPGGKWCTRLLERGPACMLLPASVQRRAGGLRARSTTILGALRCSDVGRNCQARLRKKEVIFGKYSLFASSSLSGSVRGRCHQGKIQGQSAQMPYVCKSTTRPLRVQDFQIRFEFSTFSSPLESSLKKSERKPRRGKIERVPPPTSLWPEALGWPVRVKGCGIGNSHNDAVD